MVREDDGNRLSRLSSGLNLARRISEDHVDRQADQLGCEPGKLFNFVGPAKLDDDVLTLDPPRVAQTCPQYLDPRGPSGSGAETQVSNPLHPCRLLPSRALHLGREQQSTASDQSNERLHHWRKPLHQTFQLCRKVRWKLDAGGTTYGDRLEHQAEEESAHAPTEITSNGTRCHDRGPHLALPAG